MRETNFSAGRVYLEKGENEAALVERILAGDLRAFSLLVDRYQKTVFNLALRMLHDADDAEDVAQAVFLKIYERLSQYDSRYRFFSWMYRIAMNETLNFLRQRKPMEQMEESAVVTSPVEEIERADIVWHMDEALMRLPSDQRAVVVLKHFEGFSYEEIAKMLNITEKKVKSRLFSARQMLRVVLESRGVNAA
jgi:RNA polymerase sigma-70 factor, ECF subfamily